MTPADDAVFRQSPVVSLHRNDPSCHSVFVGTREDVPRSLCASRHTTCLWQCYLILTTAISIGGQAASDFTSNILNNTGVFFLSASDNMLLQTQARTMYLPSWSIQIKNWAAICVSAHLFLSGPASTSSVSSLLRSPLALEVFV